MTQYGFFFSRSSVAEYVFSVVIPVYNKWELTEACLRRLQASARGHVYEVIVVDNGSFDATKDALSPLGETLFGSRFHAIRLETNRNFGPACNRGAQLAEAPLLFFLNNDTLPTNGWADALVEGMRDNARCVALSPLLLYPDDTVQHLGVAFSLKHPVHLYQHLPYACPLVQKKRSFQVLSAAALMIWKEKFLQVGGFYEAYQNGFEDVDLCLRLVQQGGVLESEPKSVIYHFESQTQGRKEQDDTNGKILFERCGRLFRTDLHIYGHRDGLRPYIADDLDIAFTVSREQSEELFSAVQEQPVERIEEIVTDNPLWLEGKRHLAEWFVQERNFPAAIVLYSVLAAQSRCLADYEHLLSLEPYATGATMSLFQEARKTSALLQARTANCTMIRICMRQVSRIRDPLLLSLYKEKYAELQKRVSQRFSC